jgi:hypothetical protein
MGKIWALIVFCFGYLICHPQRIVGLLKDSIGSMEGYVLFAPINLKTTYLTDKYGKLVHAWKSAYKPLQSVCLLPNKKLHRPSGDSTQFFVSLGSAIELREWDSNIIWPYKMSDSLSCLHHDVCPLPNGNTLVIMWNKKTGEEALDAFRDSVFSGKAMCHEKIIELKPIGKDSAYIVWAYKKPVKRDIPATKRTDIKQKAPVFWWTSYGVPYSGLKKSHTYFPPAY